MTAVQLDRFASDDGQIELEVLPGIGARFHRLRAFGHDLLRTPPSFNNGYREQPFFWGSYVMAPWCNRLVPGTLAVGARTLNLEVNFRDGTAIHGQVHDRPWETEASGRYRIRGGGNGWPWEYEVCQDVSVDAGGLDLALSLVNRSSDPMPGGIGIHPWFLLPVEVAIHANLVYEDNLATTRQPVGVSGRHDQRALRAMVPGIDATWADVAEPPDPRVDFHWPGSGIRAVMHAVGPSLHIVAAAPPDVNAVAVEPETQAPDGIRRLLDGDPGAMQWIAPGESLNLRVRLEISRD